MVKPFQFARLPKIYFKNGTLSDLPALIRLFGKSVILVTGKKSFVESERGSEILNKLNSEGISYKHVTIDSEPSPEIIDYTVSVIGRKKVDVVVAIGGGSVLDAGKSISAMLYKTGSVIDYLEDIGTKEHPGTKVPFIAAPTTSGTGSEATKNAVISRIGKKGFKRSLRHDNFVPDIALVDPELTINCPTSVTAASGMDCFSQLTEAFLSDKSNPYTDALAIEGLKSIRNSLEKAYNDGSDLSARTGMSFAALTSGICLANAGLGVVHGFASSIGGMYRISHGVICGTLMAAANEVNVRRLKSNPDNREALKKYSRLGKIFLEGKRGSDDYYIDGFISCLHDLTNELHLPGLKESGVEVNILAAICDSTDCKNNPVKLDPNDLMEILSQRFI
ncbi:MAG: iron-containing alcohol dehydrogenase [Bacteroidales bacterium]